MCSNVSYITTSLRFVSGSKHFVYNFWFIFQWIRKATFYYKFAVVG